MVKIPKNFCIVPFLHHYVSPQGIMTPCCFSSQAMGDVTKNTMEEIFQNEDFNKLREEFLRGDFPSGCRRCQETEELGQESMRQSVNEVFRKDVIKTNLISDGSGRLTYYKPRYFDIRFSNVCNLSCRSCGPLYSSKWAAEEGSINYQLPESVKNDFLKHLPYVEEIYLAGGEPLLIKENIHIIDEVKKINPKIRIIYNSNLSTLNFHGINYIDFWKGLENFFLFVSMDDLEEKGEYIRSGLNFSQFKRNLSLISSAKISFSFQVVVSVINAFSMRSIIKFFENEFPEVIVHYTLLLDPVPLRISVLKADDKLALKRELESVLGTVTNQTHASFLRTMLKELESDYSHILPETLNYLKMLDQRRNESFKDVYPDHPLAYYF